jgi:hypothetical protein
MMKRLAAVSVLMLGAAVFGSPAHAQRRGVSFSRSGVRTSFVRLRSTALYFPGSGYEPYYYYSDYDSEPGMGDAPPSWVMVPQAAQPASPAPKPADSLMLELQGDHWVRVTNFGQSQTERQSGQAQGDRGSNLPPAAPSASPRKIQTAEPVSELPTAVLMFRDGHKEEIGRYVIAGSTIFLSADYWSSGSWTRKVQVAELDVPATLKLNQERGAKFSLPSGPNEVMIRP